MIAATLSPVLGLICSLIAWLVTAKKQGGVRIFKALIASSLPSLNYGTNLGTLCPWDMFYSLSLTCKGEILTLKSLTGSLRSEHRQQVSRGKTLIILQSLIR